MPIVDDQAGLPPLPPETQESIGIMNRGEELGASRNIRRINNIFILTAKHWQQEDPNSLIKAILGTAKYYIENRGKNTPAIGNAINLVLVGLSDIKAKTNADVLAFLESSCLAYNDNSLTNVKTIASLGANLLSSSSTILAYDYSSSQMAVLNELGKRGQKKHLIIPESRDLDGGRPIVKEATEHGHTVDFVIDMAIAHFMPRVDAVLVGAETIFANGGFWTTIGTLNTAILADYFKVPFYVPTELIKIAPYSYQGIDKTMVFDDYSSLLDYPKSFEHPELISVTAPAFDFIPPPLISSYITERGFVNPSSLGGKAKEYLMGIGVDPLNE